MKRYRIIVEADEASSAALIRGFAQLQALGLNPRLHELDQSSEAHRGPIAELTQQHPDQDPGHERTEEVH